MSYLYDHPFTFDVPTHEDGEGGWTRDCGNKLDFDPILLHFSCRLYPDGDYICSLYLGEQELVQQGFVRAANIDEGRAAVRRWCEEQATRIIKLLADNGYPATEKLS